MPRNQMLKLKDAFGAPLVKAAAPGELILLADAPKYKAAEDIADKHAFSGKQREQFIKQSVMLARHLEVAAQRKKPPVSQQSHAGWTIMGQQQQAGGLLFKGPSQK